MIGKIVRSKDKGKIEKAFRKEMIELNYLQWLFG